MNPGGIFAALDTGKEKAPIKVLGNWRTGGALKFTVKTFDKSLKIFVANAEISFVLAIG